MKFAASLANVFVRRTSRAIKSRNAKDRAFPGNADDIPRPGKISALVQFGSHLRAGTVRFLRGPSWILPRRLFAPANDKKRRSDTGRQHRAPAGSRLSDY